MRRRPIFATLFLVVVMPAFVFAQGSNKPQTAPHDMSGVMEGTLTFVPFDFNDLSDLYAIHSVGVSTGRLKSLGFSNMFTVQKPTEGGGVIDGHVWIVTPSGDRIVGRYEGTTVPGEKPGQLLGQAEFVIKGGTGRFVNASGLIHATAYVTFLGFDVWTWPVTWVLEGTVYY
jgi:hypothetical protein